MGCMGTKHTKERAANGTGYTWWDLDNVTRFFHALGHNVFILSMPLVGVNFDSRRSTNLTDHWWFQHHESLGDATIRYFCEPDVVLAGLSGGGWTTSLVAAMDPRVVKSIPVAGVLPWSLRFDRTAAGIEATGDIGDYEQICKLKPFPFKNGARHKGYGWRRDAGREYCQFLLAGFERHRWQLQIFHEDDTCCYAAAGRHQEFLGYESDIRNALAGQQLHGWFTVVVTDHRLHELCAEDKKVIQAALTMQVTPKNGAWDMLPCDVLHGKLEAQLLRALGTTCVIMAAVFNSSAARHFMFNCIKVGAKDVQVNFVADSEYPICFGGLGGYCVPEASTWEIFMDEGSEQDITVKACRYITDGPHPVLKMGLAKADTSRGRWQEVFTQWEPWQSAKAMMEAYATNALEGASELAMEDGDEE
eukprot:s636_g14.t2